MTTSDSHNRAGPPERSDSALIAAVANGDERALRQFYERNAPWLAVRLRRTLPVSAVEDVLQETFLAVWRGAASYAGSGEAGGWLWGIARRQAALWLRKHGRTDVSFDEAIGAIKGSSADPAHEAIARLELQQAFAAAGNPGSASRDLARRVFIEDQSLVDIAADLDVPTGTIKSRVFKLRQTMKLSSGREVER
ncbi:MAG: sigma-70 family RNA polymerase sigma factor [Chloroflexota bacterium]|nr:sigma-70 family RNA polymerase sigma factor [Chloroflexota bacterium]